jgi:hypothetical protein
MRGNSVGVGDLDDVTLGAQFEISGNGAAGMAAFGGAIRFGRGLDENFVGFVLFVN